MLLTRQVCSNTLTAKVLILKDIWGLRGTAVDPGSLQNAIIISHFHLDKIGFSFPLSRDITRHMQFHHLPHTHAQSLEHPAPAPGVLPNMAARRVGCWLQGRGNRWSTLGFLWVVMMGLIPHIVKPGGDILRFRYWLWGSGEGNYERNAVGRVRFFVQ